MKMLKLIIVLQLFFNLHHALAQADIDFERYSVKDGLSSSVINSICQDKYGFLWIATENGLNRFDGYNFKVYKHDPNDSTSIPGDNLNSVMVDHEGNIWVAGFEVVAKLDRSTNKFTRFSIQKYYSDPTTVLSIVEDSQNRKWISTSLFGIERIDEHTNTCRIIVKSDSTLLKEWNTVSPIIETRKGEILVSDYGKLGALDEGRLALGLYKFNERSNTFDLIKKIPESISTGVTRILEDDFGNLWLADFSEGNILMLDQGSGEFRVIPLSIPSLNIKTVTVLFKDNNGYLWIGTTNGLIKYNPVVNEFEYHLNDKSDQNSISSNQVTSIFQDSFGQLWIGTNDGGLNKLDLGRQPIHLVKLPHDKFRHIPMDAVSCLTTSPENENIVWIGTNGNGLFRYDRRKNEFDIFNHEENNSRSIGSNSIISMSWDKLGNLWVATDSSLAKVNTGSKEVNHYLKGERQLSENYNAANEILCDKTGKLWLATNNGVEIFIPQNGSLKRLPNIMNRTYDKQLVDDMLSLVLASKPYKSILRVGNLQNLTEEFEITKPTKTLLICLGEGRVGFNIDNWGDHGWIEDETGKTLWGMTDVEKSFNFDGAFKNRLQLKTLELQPGKYKLRYKSDQGYYYGMATIAQRPSYDSLLWGIQIFELDEKKYREFESLLNKESHRSEAPFEIAYSIEFSTLYENVIWIGTNNKGLFKYNFNNDQYEQFKPNPDDSNPMNDITCIVEDDYGMVWFTTPSGLGKLNPGNNQITFITDKDGLPANNVKSILLDNYKNIWVSSIVGLSEIIRASENEISSILNFTTQDGLQGFQFSFAAHKSSNGELFFGGNNGFNSFFPGRTNRIPPLIAITDFNTGAQTSREEGKRSFITGDQNSIEIITLPFDQNDISIEFASIHFAHPERNKVYYKMDGINPDWIKDNRRFASFTNLAPGDYTFYLKASNGDGIWNDREKSIRIIISPPWWRTWWAYIAYALIFLALVFLVDRFQRRRLLEKERLQSKEKELEQAREIEKAYTELKTTQAQLIQAEKMASLGELTAGIAHEIQNPLNFVNNFSEVNSELIAEMNEELDKGNVDEAKEISKDVSRNLEKINYHGKRADAIVKGMLQHSNRQNGQKVPTDINALADEYLRLSYHGLKAKDKSFRVDFKLDADESLPRVNVVPQDIGRMLLNLINNAFYAVDKKAKKINDGFRPMVSVSTKLKGSNIEIRVVDNGDGIPDEIKDKIFQPFFTTKPTGEGTGLGLSMSYDIVTKGHGGKMDVQTKVGQGTEFIIELAL